MVCLWLMIILSALQFMTEEIAVVGFQVDFYREVITHPQSLEANQRNKVNRLL